MGRPVRSGAAPSGGASEGVLLREPPRPLPLLLLPLLSLPCSDWLSWLRLDRLLLECELPRLDVGVGARVGVTARPGRAAVTGGGVGSAARNELCGEPLLCGEPRLCGGGCTSEKGKSGAGAGAAAAGVTGLDTLPLLPSRLPAGPGLWTRWLASSGDGDEPWPANALPLRSGGAAPPPTDAAAAAAACAAPTGGVVTGVVGVRLLKR